MWVTSSLTTVLTPTAVALGNFDGIHQGHRQVIQPILHQATSVLPPDRTYATVVTFHPHPQAFFSGQSRPLLTPIAEKVAYLKQLGVEQLVLLPFDRALACLNPQEFVEEILVRRLQATHVSVGQDFCFGQHRAGTAADLQRLAAAHGITVTTAALEFMAGDRISSSAIRQALQQGDLESANQLLGRPYALVGQVVQGQQLGRTLGFPTANLQLPPEKFLPQMGVYAVQVYRSEPGCELLPSCLCLPGVMNIGQRPTVAGTQLTVEVHLLDWAGDLYGQTLLVHLKAFLRPEHKFASLDELKAQIQTDCAAARDLFATSSVEGDLGG